MRSVPLRPSWLSSVPTGVLILVCAVGCSSATDDHRNGVDARRDAPARFHPIASGPDEGPSGSFGAFETAAPVDAPRTDPPRDGVPENDDPGAPPTLSPSRPKLVEGEDSISVRLSVPPVPDGQRVTLSLEADGDALDDLEHRFEPDAIEGGDSEATLRLKLPIAMGPRRAHERELRVRTESDGRVHETRFVVDVEPTEAPDVYLLIGQSNMEGYSQRGSKEAGEGEPDEPNPRIRQLNVTRNSRTAFPELADLTRASRNFREEAPYLTAEDPLHDDRRRESTPKSGTSIGPGLTFAKEALTRTTATIYLVPAAWGATGFCANDNGDLAWNATPYAAPGLGGTLLLERALLRVDKVLDDTGGVLRGILWHQGGADSNDSRCAETYADNLDRMVRRLRREIREDPRGEDARGDEAPVPFIVATQSKGADERGDFSVHGEPKRLVDAAQRAVAETIPHADWVNNDDLVPPAYPCGRSSCVHFGARAMREQGRRFDAALRRVLERR